MSTFASEKILSIKPMRIEEETMFMQKQGIVTILASEYRASATTSLRRTLSADMSSKKWLSQNQLSPMKKTASSEELSHAKATAECVSLSSSEEDFEEMKEIEAEAEHDHQKPGPFDMWSSILSQKAKDEASNLSPYVHPLVKKSKMSFLSEKSLQICTESLGSESGSDEFSSYPSSETGETEEDNETEEMTEVEVTNVDDDEEELHVPKYNYAPKKSLPRSFPPPISSQSLQMRPRRDNGRLFLQAVSVPSQNNFCAQRQDGRLVLTFASNLEDHEDDHVAEEEEEEEIHVGEELEEEFEEDDDKEEDYETEEIETVKEEQAQILPGGVLALMMNKNIGLVNKSPRWSEKFNFEVATKFKDVNGVKVQQPSTLLAQSLPSTAKAASPVPNPFFSHQQKHNHQSSNDGDKLVVLRGKNGDYLVHSLKSCKDSRRSFLFWEPYCIATS